MKNLFKKWFGKKEKENKTCCGCCVSDAVEAPIKSDKKGEEELVKILETRVHEIEEKKKEETKEEELKVTAKDIKKKVKKTQPKVEEASKEKVKKSTTTKKKSTKKDK